MNSPGRGKNPFIKLLAWISTIASLVLIIIGAKEITGNHNNYHLIIAGAVMVVVSLVFHLLRLFI